jgi:hypothetical protein
MTSSACMIMPTYQETPPNVLVLIPEIFACKRAGGRLRETASDVKRWRSIASAAKPYPYARATSRQSL